MTSNFLLGEITAIGGFLLLTFIVLDPSWCEITPLSWRLVEGSRDAYIRKIRILKITYFGNGKCIFGPVFNFMAIIGAWTRSIALSLVALSVELLGSLLTRNASKHPLDRLRWATEPPPWWVAQGHHALNRWGHFISDEILHHGRSWRHTLGFIHSLSLRSILNNYGLGHALWLNRSYYFKGWLGSSGNTLKTSNIVLTNSRSRELLCVVPSLGLSYRAHLRWWFQELCCISNMGHWQIWLIAVYRLLSSESHWFTDCGIWTLNKLFISSSVWFIFTSSWQKMLLRIDKHSNWGSMDRSSN